MVTGCMTGHAVTLKQTEEVHEDYYPCPPSAANKLKSTAKKTAVC